jgi:uncharacterized membrane protein
MIIQTEDSYGKRQEDCYFQPRYVKSASMTTEQHITGPLTTTRVEALSDAIFAFSMTLLVLNLNVPDSLENPDPAKLLVAQVPRFAHYFTSFILLAVFWLAHHQQFQAIRRSDLKLLWTNIFTLMFIALVPFSTDLVGDYIDQMTTVVLFTVNLMVIGLLLTVNWLYATHNNRLVEPDTSATTRSTGTRRNALIPLPDDVLPRTTMGRVSFPYRASGTSHRTVQKSRLKHNR